MKCYQNLEERKNKYFLKLHKMRRSSRNTFSFPDFSLRRLLLQGARAARGSPPLGSRLCDAEKGNSKHAASSSTKVISSFNFIFIIFIFFETQETSYLFLIFIPYIYPYLSQQFFLLRNITFCGFVIIPHSYLICLKENFVKYFL